MLLTWVIPEFLIIEQADSILAGLWEYKGKNYSHTVGHSCTLEDNLPLKTAFICKNKNAD